MNHGGAPLRARLRRSSGQSRCITECRRCQSCCKKSHTCQGSIEFACQGSHAVPQALSRLHHHFLICSSRGPSKKAGATPEACFCRCSCQRPCMKGMSEEEPSITSCPDSLQKSCMCQSWIVFACQGRHAVPQSLPRLHYHLLICSSRNPWNSWHIMHFN